MWAQLVWPVQWELSGILTDITFLEPFPVVVALNIWGYYLRNKKIIIEMLAILLNLLSYLQLLSVYDGVCAVCK
jgi:hypothetical protein